MSEDNGNVADTTKDDNSTNDVTPDNNDGADTHRMTMAIPQIQKQVIMVTKISLLAEKQLIQMTIQQMEQRMQKDQRQRVTMRATF